MVLDDPPDSVSAQRPSVTTEISDLCARHTLADFITSPSRSVFHRVQFQVS